MGSQEILGNSYKFNASDPIVDELKAAGIHVRKFADKRGYEWVAVDKKEYDDFKASREAGRSDTHGLEAQDAPNDCPPGTKFCLLCQKCRGVTQSGHCQACGNPL